MSCRQTESGSGLDDGGGREAHNHNTDVALQHLTPKCTARENKKDQNYISGGKAAAARRSQYVNPYRPLLKQACKTTTWSFQCLLLEAECLLTKAFFKIQSRGGRPQKVSLYEVLTKLKGYIWQRLVF